MTDNVDVIGAAKVIQLGKQKMLVIEVANDAPEGDYTIKNIDATVSGPTGAIIVVGCAIRWGASDQF